MISKISNSNPLRAKKLVLVISLLGFIVIALNFSLSAQEKEKKGASTVPRRDIRQSHLVHVTEQELNCTECHRGAQKDQKPGMPEMDICADCHEEETDDEKENLKGCLHCHTFANPSPECTKEKCTEDTMPEFTANMGPKPFGLKYAKKGEKGGFSHNTHFKKNVTCNRCHGEIAKEGRIPFPSGKYMPTANKCYNCHSKSFAGFTHKNHIGRDIQCSKCHGNVATEGQRPFPKGKYLPDVEVQCRECHKPVSTECITCHTKEIAENGDKPSNHTPELITE